MGLRSNFKPLFIQFAPMASKSTPKKFYEKLTGSMVISRCRACNSVTEPNYSRNLFRYSNILRNAKAAKSLPHLVCLATKIK